MTLSTRISGLTTSTRSTPPQLRIYGMKELEVRDLDGYVICFGEEIQESG